jgi:outer membrane protein OmpA-like peptidoglycan-associated protein
MKSSYRTVLFINLLNLLNLALLSACATNTTKTDFAEGVDPHAAVADLRNRLQADQAKQEDQISPESFQKAANLVAQAQHDLDQGKSSDTTLGDSNEAASYLKKVESNYTRYSNQLTPVINARQAAIDAKAPTTEKEDFSSADHDFASFGHDIEDGNFHPQAGDISKLEAKYSTIELESVKRNNLGDAFALIKKAADHDGQEKAPHTFAEAQTKYDTAARAIEANRRNPENYQAEVAEANIAAQKLDQVLTTITVSKSSEAAAVKIYDQQQQLAATRNSLGIARNQTTEAENQVAAEQQSVASLQGQNERYASQAAEEKKIETIKAEFQPSEAEVLRDGNKIILRLKGMKFSTARSELTPSSLGTLQKVKEMIAAVPYSKVTVEGNTDSTGSEEKNMALSQKRAEIVEKYLVAENSVPADKIEARGFGYEHPLTSNKTAEGRATNRRVDVVIDTMTDPKG